jgi:hypothetical protein
MQLSPNIVKLNPAMTTHAALLAALLPHGVKQADAAKTMATFDPIQLMTLILTFMGTYGASIISVLAAVITAFQAPGGLTLASVETLVATYGPTVYAIIRAVATMLGITLPTGLPTIPPTPAS